MLTLLKLLNLLKKDKCNYFQKNTCFFYLMKHNAVIHMLGRFGGRMYGCPNVRCAKSNNVRGPYDHPCLNEEETTPLKTHTFLWGQMFTSHNTKGLFFLPISIQSVSNMHSHIYNIPTVSANAIQA